jgi:hypothetical protein
VLHSRTPARTDAPAAADPTTHGPGDPKAVYAKGQAVDIHWGSSWWPGSVLEIDGNKYRAHYEGYGSGSDEWLLADRLRPRAADDFQALFAADAAAEADAAPKTDAASATNAADPNATYSAGDAVDILWNSSWWAGRIKKKDGKRYRIGYDGYGTQWDEWVTAERLRPRTKR